MRALSYSLGVVMLALLFVGCASSENAGGGQSETACLGEEDFQRIRGERTADPAAAEIKYLGQRFCLVGEALKVRYLSNSIYVTLLFGRDVAYVVAHYRDPSLVTNGFEDEDAERQRYRALEEWVSTYGEGHALRVTCKLYDFVPPDEVVVHTRGLPMFSECMISEE